MTYPSERNRDAWRDVNRANALTQAEVQALPVGTAVAIVWSGGNGPARYVINEQSEEFGTYVRLEGMEHWVDRGQVRDPVSFVGPERFHTHVVMAEQERRPSPSAEPPAPATPTGWWKPPAAWAGSTLDAYAFYLIGAVSTVMLPPSHVMPSDAIQAIKVAVDASGPSQDVAPTKGRNDD